MQEILRWRSDRLDSEIPFEECTKTKLSQFSILKELKHLRMHLKKRKQKKGPEELQKWVAFGRSYKRRWTPTNNEKADKKEEQQRLQKTRTATETVKNLLKDKDWNWRTST